MKMRKRDNDRIREGIAELMRMIPGATFHLSWSTGVWGEYGYGWRLSVKLPPELERQLDVAVLAAHKRNPFEIKREWIRWPDGLSVAGDPDLRKLFADAREQVERMRGYFTCPACGNLLGDAPAAAVAP